MKHICETCGKQLASSSSLTAHRRKKKKCSPPINSDSTITTNITPQIECTLIENNVSIHVENIITENEFLINKPKINITKLSSDYRTDLEQPTGKKIRYLFHISDIHIRKSHLRKDEYLEVFNELCNYFKSREEILSESLICVTGDIFHEKCQYNEISIELFFKFFVNLLAYCPIMAIAGNHDSFVMRNEYKKDGIYPLIINAIGAHKLYYLQKTGIYIYENLAFYVEALLDRNEHDINIYDVETQNKTKIGLFHGTVCGERGISLYNDYIIKKYDKVLSQFANMNYVLLGDIHKSQYLNESKTAAYVGSLIQQNYAEDLEKGILVWDLQLNVSEFVKIKNNYGYVVLHIDNGEIKNYTEAQLEKIPHNIKLQIIHTNTDKNVCEKIINNLKKQRKLNYISKLWKDMNLRMYNETNIKLHNELNLREKLKDVNFQNQLIVDYYAEVFDRTIIEGLITVNVTKNNLLTPVDEDMVVNNKDFKPISLAIDNMFCYGEGNKIYFENGIILLDGPNDSGKSSALEALLYALYETTTKSKKKSDVMNIHAHNFRCELEFEVGGERYKVIRFSTSKTRNNK